MQIILSATWGASALGMSQLGEGLAVLNWGGQVRLIYAAEGQNLGLGLALPGWSAPGSGVFAPWDPLGSLSAQPGHGLAWQVSGEVVRLFSFGAIGGGLMMQTIGADGLPGAASPVATTQGPLAGVHSFEILGGPGGSLAALSFDRGPGFRLYDLSPAGGLDLRATVTDSAKTYLGDVSDTLWVPVGGKDYLLTLSALEGGLTSFSIGANGRPVVVDSLGTGDGLPLAGAAQVERLTLGGTTYAVVAATLSSALSVVRVNDMGCLFATDTMYDDRTTRFAHPQALDSFQWQGRGFIVTAGTDAGIQLLELLPDGTLAPFAQGVFETGAGLGAVTGLDAAVAGGVLHVHAVDATGQRLMDFTIDLSDLGGTIMAGGGTTNGTALGDLIWGRSGAQVLNGGGGEDWIYDGSGSDTLTGGAGADVFVFARDGALDVVADFQLHQDRIDLSQWGGIYAAAALSVTPTSDGAILSFGKQAIELHSADGASLSAGSFGDTDFIFI